MTTWHLPCHVSCVIIAAMSTTALSDNRSYGERLRRAREGAGLSLIDAMVAIREHLPRPMWITNETLRRHEKGVFASDQASPLLIAALAMAYDVSVVELLPEAADQLGQLYHLLEEINESHLRPPPGPPTNGGNLVELGGRDSNSQPNG